MSSSQSNSQALANRVQSFVSENRRAIIIGAAAAAVAVGGVAYYASTSRRPDDDTDSEKSGRRSKGKKDKKSKGKGKKGRKSVNDPDGPLLEELPPKLPSLDNADGSLNMEYLATLSHEERDKLAETLKLRGNDLYKDHKYEVAHELYSRAMIVTHTPQAMFYSNRAACYMNYDTPDWEKAIEDCNTALKVDHKYIKALNRRAMSLEHLGRLEEALQDFTAVTILDKFKNDVINQSVERVLKKLAEPKAVEIFASRGPRLPPQSFVDSYFSAFRPRPLPTLPENPSTGDNTLILALQALEARDYPHALSFVNEALDQGISFNNGKADALNLRGSFKFLWGDSAGAKADLEEAIATAPALTQSWVKIASVHMEQGNAAKAFESFESAIKHDPADSDIYYHRGQVLFIMGNFTEAAENYGKAMSMDPNFVFSHIQLAVAQYKSGSLANSMATFRRTLKAFPQRSEPQNYYGELLLDQQRFGEAVEKFDRAIELERARKPPMNVLPIVNKGLTMFQWKQDMSAAERIITEALELDPECEAAVATLAQISLQQGKMETAVKMFKRQTELARSEPDLVNALNFAYAADAQIAFMKNFPDMAKEIMQMPMMPPM